MSDKQLIITSPTKVRIFGLEDKKVQLQQMLKYVDKKVQYELQKNQHNFHLKNKLGYEKFGLYLDDLRKKMNQSLLMEDQDGYYTYTGLTNRLVSSLDLDPAKNNIIYPKTKPLPWLKAPKHKLRPYQENIVRLLQEARHGSVEVGTGLGKSLCITTLVREHGLKTVVMAPSANIAKQLYSELAIHLGTKYVGFVGDGKKEFKKLVVVAIDDSLAKVDDPSSEIYKELSKTELFISDESHTVAAATLQKICFGVMSKAPFRYFFSATQMRNDGLDLLLEAIIGPIVYRMTVEEGVAQGYLAKPTFVLVKTSSSVSYESKDANAMTRKHFYYNKNIIRTAADIANKAVSLMGHPVVILVEEVEQFTKLLPLLKHRVGFAHGGVTKDNKDKVPEEYHDSDTTALVNEFNRLELPILIGTSCISTGTDIRPVKTIINLRGKTSEIVHSQGTGRGTRLAEDKTEFFLFDFIVENIPKMLDHAEKRIEIYQSIYPDVRIINYK